MLRKLLLTIGLILAANVAVLAQGTIKGTVTDQKSGEAMPFTNVVVKQGGNQITGAQTDFDGIYTIKSLPVGKYDIEVSSVGYTKYIRTGVEVKASGFTVVNVQLQATAATLIAVNIEADKVPVIEIGEASTSTRMSSEDIAKMPGTSVESIVAAVGGMGYSDGGVATARGESGMVTMQNGVRKRTGVNVPKEAIAEIQVILGGTPASIGEAIGGTQIITLKPPESQFHGIVKWDSYLDYRLYNMLTVYLTGPMIKKKETLEGGGMKETTFMGFRFTGQGTFYKWGAYRPKGHEYRVVKDEIVRDFESAPIVYDPVSHTTNYAAEYLRDNDFVSIKRPNAKNYYASKDRYANFSNDVPQDVIDVLMNQAMKWSDRYISMKKEGHSESEIRKAFNEKVPMRVFAWNKNHYVDTVMTPMDSIRYYKSYLRSAFLAIEPSTGHVKAYVGGPDYRYFKYDNARQGKRQVGSTMKPFLYTLAMQEGYTPCDKVVNIPYSFPLQDTVWTPKSTDKAEYIGRTVTLKWGLTHSSNNISAYLMKQFGPAAMVEMARKMGIGSYLDPVYSLCVGSCDLNVYEMVAAYNTFPSRGVYCYPMLVTKIEDNAGNVLANFVIRKREAISDPTAYLMVNLMQGVVNEGTAGRLKWKYGLEGALAGKTGTTNDQSDGWFIGYTPKLTAGVWVGAEDRQAHFESLYYGGGANMALPIWGLFMQKVYADPTIAIGKDDVFVPPLGWSVDLSCRGDESDLSSGSVDSNDTYFE